jgi:hypothetical protein
MVFGEHYERSTTGVARLCALCGPFTSLLYVMSLVCSVVFGVSGMTYSLIVVKGFVMLPLTN